MVLIDGARIAAVGPRGAVTIPADARQIDARGRWMIPGMIDTNVHLSLYPGKILFALLDYPWAFRLYTIAHLLIAWAGMLRLARAWNLSLAAAHLAALAYAFAAPILFQYCNVIFLVGAAWIPWGCIALERLLHKKHPPALLALATVLSLQILGGDPEAAYLTVLAGALYALVIAANNNAKLRSPRLWAVATILAWIVVTLTAAYALPRIAVPEWLPSAAILRGLLWALLALAALWRCRKRPSESSLASMLVSLAAASAFAAALAAVQLVPTLEYATNTVRAADDRPERIYGFEMEPYRLIEVLWPNVFGRFGPQNRSWVHAFPPAGERLLWVPSLYVGGLTVALALGALGFRAGPPWRIWLSLIAGIALAASCGKFGGPLWIVRWFTSVQPILGPHDPLKGLNRVDPFLHDGAGSVYGLLAALLPGFNLFRYPGKLFSFTALALAALAGHGWDRLEQGHTRKISARVRGCPRCLAGRTRTALGNPRIPRRLAHSPPAP